MELGKKSASRLLEDFSAKQSPDGKIAKYKVCDYVQGDLDKGEPETYSPLVAWISV